MPPKFGGFSWPAIHYNVLKQVRNQYCLSVFNLMTGKISWRLNMFVPKATQDSSYDQAKVDSWYRKWRKVIRKWIERNSDSDIADILLLVPDLFMLCVGLIGDKRVPSPLKVSLISAVAYVLSPIDLIPEALVGAAGLIDDAGVLVFILHGLLSVKDVDPREWEDILRDHWAGDADPVIVINSLYALFIKNAKLLFGKVWTVIVKRQKASGKRDTTPTTGPIAITS